MEVEVNKNRVTAENFVNVVFMVATICILSSVIWADEHNVSSYYQNLIIATTSIAMVILDIFQEIRENKKRNLEPPGWIKFVYVSCMIVAIFCCATPLCVYIMANESTYVGKHLNENAYWKMCIITLAMVFYLVVWGYFFPIVMDIPYKNRKIRYMER